MTSAAHPWFTRDQIPLAHLNRGCERPEQRHNAALFLWLGLTTCGSAWRGVGRGVMKSHEGVALWDGVSYSSGCRGGSVTSGGTLRTEKSEAISDMFLGDYQHTLDAKGRVSLPAKFRAEMTGRLTIAKGLDKCLYIYPAEAYSAFVDNLLGKDDFDPRIRKLRRFFTTGAVEAELDSAGRISLPSVLREYAGLAKDVAVTGNGNRIELWSAEAWNIYNGGADESIEDLAKELAEFGLL